MARAGILGVAARAVRRVRRIGARRQLTPGEYRRLALSVTQNGAELTVTAVTGTGLQMRALTARSASGDHITLEALTSKAVTHQGIAAHETSVTVDLNDIFHELTQRGHLAELANGALANGDVTGGELPLGQRTATLELVIVDDREVLPKYAYRIPASAAAELPGTPAEHAYWAALGRFDHTELAEFSPVTIGTATGGTISAAIRITKYGHLTVVFGDAAPPAIDVRTRRVALSDGVLRLAGTIDAGALPLLQPHLLITGRHTPFEFTAPLRVQLDPAATQAGYGRVRYDFTTSFDVREILESEHTVPPHTLADLWIIASESASAPVARVRVGRLPYEQRINLTATTAQHRDVALDVIPYLTMKSRNLSLMLEPISSEANRRIAQLSQQRTSQRFELIRAKYFPASAQRPRVWLIGERPGTAQDNNLHLFRYLRTHRTDIDAYYVITADSPDRKNLAGLDHVIEFGSREHVDVTVTADRIIGTHHAEYLYPTRAPRLTALVRAKRVFLQHGVMGTKWMVPTYGKRSHDFSTDLVCVSSERERSYLVHDFGYEPNEVCVTGLARFDELFADDVPTVPGQVLIMPTWRDWLATPEAFESSQYFQQWRGLLEDPQLRQLQETTNTRVLFYLHSNMQQFADHFDVDGIEFISHGAADVQRLLKESAVLVTDYSSPGFDFSFLHKPVIYFQFDRNRFLGKWGSHLDLDRELPGYITNSIDQTITTLSTMVRSDYVLKPEFRERANRFITHRDRRNCERITAVIEQRPPRQKLVASLQQRETIRVVEERVRHSKAYFPMMQRLYRMLKLLPSDSNMIVFESDVGKRVSDSPKAIYDELLRRGDTRRHVWVYDRTMPVDDPQAVVVKRLSLPYFYYLARAKYWVNNQNFPYYVTRRKNGVYLQTWHGTPIKRMLHDLTKVVGRDDGYVGRVSTATAQWTHLLSPSPYATAAFRSAFRYHGPVLEEGYPRNDVLRSDQATAVRDAARLRLGASPSQQVVLYAPTFRDNQKSGKSFHFQLPFDLEQFVAECGSDTRLLLRTHMLVSSKLSIPDAAVGSVLDVSRYPDIADLYLAADVLVTDYSSVMFDFALTGKPIIFYAYDLAEYRDDIRGFYLDYLRDLPGPITETQADLFAAIRAARKPSEQQRQQIADFADRFGPHDDGHAAERVVDALLAR